MTIFLNSRFSLAVYLHKVMVLRLNQWILPPQDIDLSFNSNYGRLSREEGSVKQKCSY